MEAEIIRSPKLLKFIHSVTKEYSASLASEETRRLLKVITVIKQVVKENRSISKKDLLKDLEKLLAVTPRTINLALNIAIETKQLIAFTVQEEGIITDTIIVPTK